jgi:hypothetical protein
MTSFCVSTVIFARAVASAKLLFELNVMVNEPFPEVDVPLSAVIPETYP